MSSLRESTVPDELRNEVLGLSEDGKISQADISSDRELRLAYASLGKSSLYFFAKAILGYKDLTWRTHKDLADFIQDSSIKRGMVLVPRGCFKTSLGTVSYALWSLINNPNETILIANQTSRNAELMLMEAAHHIDGSNGVMNWVFPEAIRPGEKWKPWSQEMLNFPARTETTQRTPSLMTIGVGGRAESLHFRKILNDDLIGEKARDSEIEMLEAGMWHDYSVSLFVEPSKDIERWYGTRWGPGDIYERPIESGEYKLFFRPAEDIKTGWVFFPERVSADFLRDLRRKNFFQYMANYMNDPQSPAGREFQPEWLQEFRLEKGEACPMAVFSDGMVARTDEMNVGIFVDPAGSGDEERKVGDDARRAQAKKSVNVVSCVGVHDSGRWCLLDMWSGRGVGENPELEVANEMMKMAKRWNGIARRGFVEAYGAQTALITIYDMVCRKAGFTFRYEPLPKGEKRAKAVRIRTTVGAVAQERNLFIRKGHDLFQYEFTRFPQSSCLDSLDTMAWAILTLKKPTSRLEATPIRDIRKRQRAMRARFIGRGGY